MMDYKALFDDVMYRKYDTALLPDDEEFIRSIRERAGKMERKNSKMRKPAVIAASIAAAAALTVSVGAAADWDIAALFTQQSKALSERTDEWLKSDMYTFFKEDVYPYMDLINVPENAGSYSADYVHDREITERITRDMSESFEFEKFTVNMKGCLYDGLNAVFFFDIEYKNIFDALAADPHKLPVIFYSGVRGGSTDNEVLDRDGCTLSCTKRMDISGIVGGVDFRAPFDVSVHSFDYAKGEYEQEYDETTGEYRPKTYTFTMEMPDIDDLIYEKEISQPIEVTGYGTGTLDRIRISPTMITFDISNYDNTLPAMTPVYVTMKDGTVLSLTWERDVSGILDDDHNVVILQCGIRCIGTVLDVNNIKSVQFYNEIIEINR